MLGAGMQCTVVLRNIACKLTPAMVKDVLDEAELRGAFTFVCVPCIPSGRSNLGYAFVGFRTVENAAECRRIFHGQVFGRTSSSKICEVELANEEKGSRALTQMCRRQRHGRQLGLLVCDEPMARATEASEPASREARSRTWSAASGDTSPPLTPKRTDRVGSMDGSEGSTTCTPPPSTRGAASPRSLLADVPSPLAATAPSLTSPEDAGALGEVLERLVAEYLSRSTLLGHLQPSIPATDSFAAGTPLAGGQLPIGVGKAQMPLAPPPGLRAPASGRSFPVSVCGASALGSHGEMQALRQGPHGAGDRVVGYLLGGGLHEHVARLDMAAALHFYAGLCSGRNPV